MKNNYRSSEIAFGLFLPILMILIILIADYSEGSQHAYIGILASVPPLAAVFGSVRTVAVVSFAAVTVGVYEIFLSGEQAYLAQERTVLIIALVSVLSIMAAKRRMVRDLKLAESKTNAAINESEMRHAKMDFLTGHLNRYGFTQAISGMGREPATLVIFDLDKFKSVNDLYGHEAGDTFLKIVSTRLFNDLSHNDIFGRWGGDEFLAIIHAEDAIALAVVKRVIQSSIASPVAVDGKLLEVRISAGLTKWDRDLSFEANFECADKALYEAKDRGGCQAVNFSELPNHGKGSKHAH